MKLGLTWPADLLDRLGNIAHGALHESAVHVLAVHHGDGTVHAVTATWQDRGPTYAIVKAIVGQAAFHVLDRRPPMRSERRICSCDVRYGRRDVVITTDGRCPLHGEAA